MSGVIAIALLALPVAGVIYAVIRVSRRQASRGLPPPDRAARRDCFDPQQLRQR